MREDWIEIKLGKVGDVVSGGTPRTNIAEYWDDDISWITPADLSNYTSKYIAKGRKSISKLGLEKSSAKLMPPNSVLFSSRAPIGYVAISKNELATNQGFKSLNPYPIVNSVYLFYYLKSAKQIAERNASGTTFKELSAKGFSKIPFPLAPLPEQRAIVAKIEQLFSELDNGIANLKSAKDKLEIYRQAVLKKAFEGELTKEWRERNEFEKWQTTDFKDVVESSRNGYTGRPNDNGIGNPRLGITGVTQSNSIFANVSDYRFKEISPEKALKYTLRDGDIVVCRQNGTLEYVGKFAVIQNPPKGLIYSDSLIRFRTDESKIIPKYLAYFFNSIGRKELESKCSTTAGNYSINSTNIKSTSVSYPSVTEQYQIVQEIESRLSVCDNVLQNIEEGLEKAESLRQCILKKAFEGRLLTQTELKACRREPDWEPAEELLKRIKNRKAGK